ncbi:unnamed protein product [Lampetra fluviatilis]
MGGRSSSSASPTIYNSPPSPCRLEAETALPLRLLLTTQAARASRAARRRSCIGEENPSDHNPPAGEGGRPLQRRSRRPVPLRAAPRDPKEMGERRGGLRRRPLGPVVSHGKRVPEPNGRRLRASPPPSLRLRGVRPVRGRRPLSFSRLRIRRESVDHRVDGTTVDCGENLRRPPALPVGAVGARRAVSQPDPSKLATLKIFSPAHHVQQTTACSAHRPATQ